MKRRILVAALMLLSVVALSLSNNQAVCADGYCKSCTGQCYQESVRIYYSCRTGGGTVDQCHDEEEQYEANCNAVFCSQCGP